MIIVVISHNRSSHHPYAIFIFLRSKFITGKAAVPFPYLIFFNKEISEIRVNNISYFIPYLTAQLVDALH